MLPFRPRPAGVMEAPYRVLEASKTTLTAHAIGLAFSTPQLLWHDQTEATEGDRSSQREGWPAGQGDVSQSRVEAQRGQPAATAAATPQGQGEKAAD